MDDFGTTSCPGAGDQALFMIVDHLDPAIAGIIALGVQEVQLEILCPHPQALESNKRVREAT
jgi:hypothetical protein